MNELPSRSREAFAVPTEQTPVRTQLRLPFGIYSPASADFAHLAHNGFTMVGPWYHPAPDMALLDAAAAAGLSVVFPIGDHRGRERGAFSQTRAEIQSQIDARVREFASHPAVIAWYLLPEEVRDWDASEMTYLEHATSAIRAADPEQRPVLSYQPNNRSAEHLAPVLASFDVAIKGAYANYTGHRDARAWVRFSVDELERASDVPPWLVVEMFQDPPDADVDTIRTWVRHDVYAGLIAGAKGVLVYSGHRRPGFTRYDDYLAAYEDVAHELNGSLALGDVLMAGASCRGEDVEIVEGPAEVTFEAGDTVQHMPALGRLELEHAGARWSWLVNSSAESLAVRSGSWTSARLVARSIGVHHDDADVRLPPWGVAVLRRPSNNTTSASNPAAPPR